jgi:anti-sigma B factor antagonist
MHTRQVIDLEPATLGVIDLNLEIASLPDGTQVVTVAGEIDPYTGPQLEWELFGAISNGAVGLIVDLTACTFLDSTALHVLSATSSRLGAPGRLSLVTADRHFLKIFEITGLDRLLAIHPTRTAALN